jgi:uncharacterized protein YjdB
VTWASLDPSIATVDAGSGLVTAVGAGQARIVATSGALSGHALATVTVPSLQPVNVWAPMASGTTEILHDVWGTSASDVWASGENTALALHFDGTQWRTALSGIAGVTQYYGMAVGGTSANDVLVGTDGDVLARFDGTSWTTLTPPAEYGSGMVLAVWAASPRETYVGITSVYGGTAGGVARYNQGTWTRVQGVTSVARLWGSAPGDVMVGGSTGTLWRCRSDVCASATTPGGSNAIRGLWGASAASAFAVGGGNGYVIAYDGANWTQMSGVPAVALNGITGASPTDLYAVGSGGAIVRYDGATWTAPVSGTTANLNQAWTSPAGDVFAVGDAGTILRGVRGGTVAVSTPSATAIGIGASRQLTATAYAGAVPLPGVPFSWSSSDTTIAKVGAATGLVTGVASGAATITATAAGGASNTLLVNISTSAATVVSVSVTPANPTLTGFGATQQLTATARDAANDVIAGVTFTWSSANPAVATVGAASGLVTATHTGTASITATAAGGKTGSVTVTVAPGATNTVTVSPAGSALSGVGSTQALTIQVRDVNGDLVASPTASWASLNPGVATVDPTTGVVTAVAPGQAVIGVVSGGGTGTALVTVAATAAAPVNVWVPMSTPASSANAIWGTSASDVWTVAGSTVLHYDGSSWSATTVPTIGGLMALWGASPIDVFAVGLGGAVMHYDGSAWTAMSSGSTQQLQAVWGASHGDVFTVGLNGTILHYDGSAWSPMTSGTTQPLYAVWGSSRGDVWAAGGAGTILHFDGAAWSAVASGTTNFLYSLWGSAATDVFAGGAGGTVQHWNGTSWGPGTTGSTATVRGIWGTTGSDVYGVASGGTVLFYNGSAVVAQTAGTGAQLMGVWGAGVGDVFIAVGGITGGVSAVARGLRGATLALSEGGWNVTPAGNQKQLAATIHDAANNVVSGVPFTWISRSNSVATVNALGLVTATGLGTTYVVVSVPGGLADSVAITVTKVANTVTIVPDSVTLGAGATQGLVAQVRDTSGNLVAATVTYASLNPAVATVDLTGTVTAVEAGQAVIVATTSGGLTGSMLVTVTKPVATPVNLWATVASGTTAVLQGVWGASASSVFVVGNSGSILNWNGAAWVAMASGTTAALYDVWGSSSTDVYAVGAGGAILRYSGTNWSPMTSGTGQTLFGAWGASRSDIFAVGANGTILRYDGTSWSAMASGTGQTLNAVWGASRGSVFAVGSAGSILHYDGTAWTAMPNPLASGYPNASLMDVWGTSPTDVYAVTSYTTNQLLHYNGTTWSTVSPSPYATGVWGTTSTNLFVVGSSGSIQRYDGATWTAMTTGTTQSLTEAWTNAVSDVTVVGGGGTILRGIRGATATVDTVGGWTVTPQGNQRQLSVTARDASNNVVTGVPFGWQSTVPSVATVNGSGLVTAVALGTTDIIAAAPGGLADTLAVTVTVVANTVKVTPVGVVVTGVGSTSVLAVEVRDGTGNVVVSPTVSWVSANPAVATVDGSGMVTAVAAGQTSVSATSGSITAYATVTVNVPGVTPVNLWTPMAAPPISWVGAVWGSSPTNVYVTNGANVLYRYNGTSWSPVSTGSPYGLTAVWGTSASDIFAVGGNGQVAHYDGSAWTSTSSGTGQTLRAAWGASHADVFAVGSNGAIVHYDGTNWSVMASGTTLQLNGVWGTSGTDVFAVGGSGTLLHYDGSAWSPMTGGSGNYFYGVWGTSGTDVFAVAGGPIYHYDGSSWTNAWYACCTNSIGGTSHSDVYSAGWNGTYARFDGAAWTGGSFTGSPTLQALWSAGGADVMAVGYANAGPAMIMRGVRGATIKVVPAGGWSVTAQGAQQQLADTVKDASGTVIGGVPVTWASRNTAVATVDASGLVTAVSLGTDTIVATAMGGATGSYVVTVSFIANSVSVAPLGASIAGAGTTQAFTATVRDVNGNIVPSPTLTWTSSNPAVATINVSTGVATAVAAGQTTISATSTDGATNYALLTVAAAVGAPVNLWALVPSGTTYDVNGVWGSSASDIFAVGGNGVIVHSNGTAWSTMASGTTLYLYDVWGTSGSDVFAVGGAGAILHYNGTSWSTMTSGSTVWLYDVWGSSSKDVFVVGDNGTILHYDGSGWSAMVSGTTQSLQAVWGTSRSDVYAVGYNGALLHYDGTAWSAMSGGSGAYFYDVWGMSSTNVYAASSNGLMHYDGSAWSAVDNNPGWSQSVWGTTSSEMYLPQSASIVSFDGSAWHTLNTPRYLTAVWGTSAASVYVVGSAGTVLQGVRGATLAAAAGSWSVTAQGNQLQVTATARDAGANVVAGPVLTWVSTNPAVATVDATGLVTAVSVGSADIVVTALGGLADTVPVTVNLVANQVTVSPAGVTRVVGGPSPALTVQVRDAAGNIVPSPTVTWTSSNASVATVNASGVVTAVAAGQATIIATSGGQSGTALVTVTAAVPAAVNLWAPAVAPAPGSGQQVFGVWGASPTNVFAVGSQGMMYRFDGTSWTTTPNVAGVYQDLRDVWGTSGGNVFVVGGGGTILHYNGSAWTTMASGTSVYLYAVWGSSGKDVYAAGDYGTVLHYDGTAWATVPVGVSNWWSPKIWGSSRQDVYILSGSGGVHFDGTSWSPVSALPWGYGIWGTSASDVYAATYGMLHFDGLTWAMMTGSSGSANALWGSSSSEVYAVRNAGEAGSWNGSTWTPFSSISDRDLWNIWGTSTADVYAVGYNWGGINAGIILRGVRGGTVGVTPASPTITGLGTTQQLTATGYAGATPVAGVAFTWTTSNPAVATVNASGLVTAVGAGSATITATAPGGAAAGTLVAVSP